MVEERLLARRPLARGGTEGLAGAVLSTPFLALALAILTWPFIGHAPFANIDISWQAGLVIGLERGLQFGREFVFTYGPLGFIHVPILFGEGLWLAAFAYQAVTRVALAAALVWVARRALPLPLALAACFVVLAVSHLNSGTTLLIFIWAFVAVSEEPPAFARPLVIYGGGLLAAIELLGKINIGVSVLAISLAALLATPRRRSNLTHFAAVFAAGLTGLWLLSGQALANLPDYGVNSLQVVFGYSRTMGIDVSPKPGAVTIALVAIAIALGGVALATASAGRRARFGSIAVFVLFAYVGFKQDFIRRGIGGREDFALLMTAAALTVASRFPSRLSPPWTSRIRIPRSILASALVAPMLAFVVWALPATAFWPSLKPAEHVSALREEVNLALSRSARVAARSAARKSLQSEYRLPAAIRKRIGGRQVAIEPWEIAVTWAYGLNWKPLPVIQDYAAYTPALDHLNAADLKHGGPATILRQNLHEAAAQQTIREIDDRYAIWDAPAAKLALICNYAPAITTPHWQLVERIAPRCGRQRALGTVDSETGAQIHVPAPPSPDAIVFARIHGLGLNVWESGVSLLYRAPNRRISVNGGEARNLDGDTAADGLIMRAPATVDFPAPFRLAPNARRFSVSIDGAAPRPIEVTFFALHVRPLSGVRPRPRHR